MTFGTEFHECFIACNLARSIVADYKEFANISSHTKLRHVFTFAVLACGSAQCHLVCKNSHQLQDHQKILKPQISFYHLISKDLLGKFEFDIHSSWAPSQLIFLGRS